MPSFIADLAVLYTDQAPAVRRWLAQFLGEACQSCPLIEVLRLAAGTLQILAADSVPSVAKQACLSSAILIRSTLGILAMQPKIPELQRLYSESQAVALAASSAAQGHKTEGPRIAGTKLYESLLLIFASNSAPLIPIGAPVPPFVAHLHLLTSFRPNPAISLNLAEKCLDALIAAFGHQMRRLGEGGSSNQASKGSPHLIVLIKALSNLITQQPDLCLNRSLPCLLNLAQLGFRVSNCTESGGIKGGDLSVGNALRNGLITILKTKVNLATRCYTLDLNLRAKLSQICRSEPFPFSFSFLSCPVLSCHSMREAVYLALSSIGSGEQAERYRQRDIR